MWDPDLVQQLDRAQNSAPATGPAVEPFRRLGLDQTGDDAGVAAPTSSAEVPNAIRI